MKVFQSTNEIGKILTIAKKLNNNNFTDHYSTIKMLLGSNSMEHQILVKSLLKAYEKQQAYFIRENFKSISLMNFKNYLGDHFKSIDFDKYLIEYNFTLSNNFLISSNDFVKFYKQEEGRNICRNINYNTKQIERFSNINNMFLSTLLFLKK